MLKVLRDDFEGQVQVSTGMTTRKEIEKIVNFFEEKDQAKSRLLLYACTSGYPVPAKDVALLEIKRLYDKYSKRIKSFTTLFSIIVPLGFIFIALFHHLNAL